MHIQIFRLYLTNLQKRLKKIFVVLQSESKNDFVHCAHSCKVTAPTDKNSGNHSKIRTPSKKE
jgi:hypothetical protein